MRIFLIGFMGSGKSHWGKQLANQLKIPYFDLDEVIAERENKSVSQIFAESGEEAFRIREREVLESLIDENATMVLSCGGGTPCFFNNIRFMKNKGTVIWLNTQVDVLVNRLLKEKTSRPVLKDIADEELKPYILKKILGRKLYYEQADIIVNEESISVDTFAEIIINA